MSKIFMLSYNRIFVRNCYKHYKILIKCEMSVRYFLLFLLLICSSCKLLSVFSMMRHGAIYPKNNLYDGNQTSEFRGLLTPVGIRQQFNLGSYLREDYIIAQQLTTSKFAPSQVEFFSSTYQRTQMSAVSFIYGLYPLEEGWTIPAEVTADKLLPPFVVFQGKGLSSQNENEPFALDKGFQPLPVRNLDDVLDNCANYDALVARRKLEIASKVAIFEGKHSIQIGKMKVLFNLTNAQANVPTMSDLYQTLESDRYLGRSLPQLYNENDEKSLNYIYEYYNTLLQDGRFARVIITPSLRMLREKLDSVVSNKTKNKMTFISCHSSNLWPILTQFNLTSAQCLMQKWNGDPVTNINCVAAPHYSANFIVELHEESGTFFVMIRYNGNYVYLCENRQTKCEYNNFVSRLKNIEVNFQDQCKVPKKEITILDQ